MRVRLEKKNPAPKKRLIQVSFNHEFLVDLDELIADRDYDPNAFKGQDISEEELVAVLVKVMTEDESWDTGEPNEQAFYERLVWGGDSRSHAADLARDTMTLDLNVRLTL